ncbi:MAG: AAC(3) family N-acetyltransferase [Eubacteriales bacterium]
MYTKNSIFEDLAQMNAPRDGAVLVHTSLRAVGEVEGRGEGFLEALIEYFTADGGLLLIPTHTWKNLEDLSRPTVDMASPETCIGTLPGIAAVHPMAHRSLHPTHSMAVFDGRTKSGEAGPAEAYIAGEVMIDTSTSPRGCYGRLYDVGGKILLIGVGHNRDTYLHSAEERIGVPNRLSAEMAPTTIRLPSGDLIERPIYHHHAEGISDVSAHYPKYEPAFRFRGAITDGTIGSAPAQLCDARIMTDTLRLIRERSGGVELLADDEPLSPALYQ